MALTGFKGFGWILGLATVSPACYMVSSQVAAERGRVESVDREIRKAQHDIRVLETEFDTRANMAQLERWNGDVLALSAPRPDQYVRGAQALASLVRGGGADGALRYAALVVPAATDAPAIATQTAAVVPSAVTPSPAAPVAVAAAAPAPSVAASVAQTAKATDRVVRSVARKAQAVAMLDDRLLSASTLGDLMSGARREAVRLR